MAGKSRKTEHNGAKKGRGAFWGPKADAKRDGNRVRRETDKRVVRDARLERTATTSAVVA